MLAAEPICYLDEERHHRRKRHPQPLRPSGAAVYRSMLMDNGDSMFIVDAGGRIEAANGGAGRLHGMADRDLTGVALETVIAADHRAAFRNTFYGLENHGQWSGRLDALRGRGDRFPAAVTVKKLSGSHAWVAIRDVSETDRLGKRLEQEKANRREMYQTLRNLVKSHERERRGLEAGIVDRIEGLLLPALEKIEQERCSDLRNSYLNILRMELVGLTKGFSRELEAPLLKLTRTEMRVCQLIQKGYTGKEIADAMNISFETIQVHRRNIRSKLGLTGRKVNLFAFLSAKPFLRPSPAA